MHVFHTNLMTALKNPSLKSSVISNICHALGILTFLYEKNNLKTFTVMKALKNIFLPKLDYFQETSNRFGIKNYEFQTAAFETWIFLTTILPSELQFLQRPYFSFKTFDNVSMLLESPHCSLGIACARAIAVILECGLNTDIYYYISKDNYQNLYRLYRVKPMFGKNTQMISNSHGMFFNILRLVDKIFIKTFVFFKFTSRTSTTILSPCCSSSIMSMNRS